MKSVVSNSTSKRIYQIDLFRFIAAMSVVLYHYLYRGYAADDFSLLDFSEIGEYFKYGYLGVDLFFIISGFVIALSIKHNSLVKFVISRFTRLYPAYWLSLTLTFLVIVFFGSPRFSATINQFLSNLTMFQNYLRIESIEGVYWSLFIELKFYMIMALFLFIRRFRNINFDYLVIVWLSLTVLNLFIVESPVFKVLNYLMMFNWSSYFIGGILFFQIYKNGNSLNRAILLLISFVVSIYIANLRLEGLETRFNSEFSSIIVSVVIGVFYALMYLVSTDKLKAINSPNLVKIGMLTYPLYLIHQFVGYIIFNNLSPYFNKYVILVSTLSFMILIAYLISIKIEPMFHKALKTKLERLSEKLV